MCVYIKARDELGQPKTVATMATEVEDTAPPVDGSEAEANKEASVTSAPPAGAAAANTGTLTQLFLSC